MFCFITHTHIKKWRRTNSIANNKPLQRWHIMKIWLFPCLNAIIVSPVYLSNTEHVKKNNPAHFFVSLSLQVCGKKWACQISLPLWCRKGILLLYYHPLICTFAPMVPPLCFHKRQRCTSSNAMANCSVFGCTDKHGTLFTVPASEEKREQWIYLL